MRKFKAYKFKKIYIDQKIFTNEKEEIKAGYLNINGLVDGGHIEYLNEDKNLNHLHILVISETKLDSKTTTSEIEKKLTNWNVVRRDDAIDDLKHMGLLLLVPKRSEIVNKMVSLEGVQKSKNSSPRVDCKTYR